MTREESVFRPYTPEDAEALAGLYRAAVRATGPSAYSREQVEAWASYPEDLEVFRASLIEGLTIVCEMGGDPAAFGHMQHDGHVHLLYTHPRFARRGLAAALLQRFEDQARAWGCTALTTVASRISRPIFQRAGYALVETETAHRQGIAFERFQMRKALGPLDPA